MNFPIFIEPTGSGFSASLGTPFNTTIQAATRDDVADQAAELIRDYLNRGGEIRWVSIPGRVNGPPGPGWLPDDDLTREWLEVLEENRAERDRDDLARLEAEDLAARIP